MSGMAAAGAGSTAAELPAAAPEGDKLVPEPEIAASDEGVASGAGTAGENAPSTQKREADAEFYAAWQAEMERQEEAEARLNSPLEYGDDWDEDGNDISRVENEKLRAAAFDRRMNELKAETTAVRDDTHPEVVRRKLFLQAKASRKRRLLEVEQELQRARAKELYELELLEIQQQYDRAVEQAKENMREAKLAELRRLNNGEAIKEDPSRPNTRRSKQAGPEDAASTSSGGGKNGQTRGRGRQSPANTRSLEEEEIDDDVAQIESCMPPDVPLSPT